jgi:N-methylhydantoinase B
VNAIELSVFVSRIESICEEMGAVLRHSAFSPNIKDRLDFSCAVFDGEGLLCAQAAHIPVHLGSMAYAMSGIVKTQNWRPGDMVVLNNPFLGGTHLPDVTMIAPLFTRKVFTRKVFTGKELAVEEDSKPIAFIVNRAHHADIGADSPGSMPLSTTLDDEGVIISPEYIVENGQIKASLLSSITANMSHPDSARGDFIAQISANQTGITRLQVLLEQMDQQAFTQGLEQLNEYGERVARASLKDIPDGTYKFSDFMDDDGAGQSDIKIALALHISGDEIAVDFTGTAAQLKGNINCPLSVAAAAVYYVFRCLMPAHTPACAGTFRAISIFAPAGCLLNANYPAAVAAGNVETSMRIVDVVLGALHQAIADKIPAASYGSMNNVAMGSRESGNCWDYYETIGGGFGANSDYDGLSARQAHMTNTLNTPIESLEYHYPLRITAYALRKGSGGLGQHRGGEGIIREMELLEPAQITLLTERRSHSPWGISGGKAGKTGENYLDGQLLPAKVCFKAKTGQRLSIKTPGGGGWGHS